MNTALKSQSKNLCDLQKPMHNLKLRVHLIKNFVKEKEKKNLLRVSLAIYFPETELKKIESRQ